MIMIRCLALVALLAAAATSRGGDLAFTVMAANLSGVDALYRRPAGRIFRGLKPDIVAVQEWNVQDGDYRRFVGRHFGRGVWFCVQRSRNKGLPNGVISRWPITARGLWKDPVVGDRGFVWATIDLPGPRDLHAVSVHFKHGGNAKEKQMRRGEAELLAEYIRRAGWPADDYLVIAGDLNTINLKEPLFAVLSSVVGNARPPADQAGAIGTSVSRKKCYDHVLANPALEACQVPVEIGGLVFSNGLVFDSRLWAPPPPPILPDDSVQADMQHMAVLKAFRIPVSER